MRTRKFAFEIYSPLVYEGMYFQVIIWNVYTLLVNVIEYNIAFSRRKGHRSIVVYLHLY